MSQRAVPSLRAGRGMRRLILALPLVAAACATPAPPPKIALARPVPVVVPPLPLAPPDWRDKPYTPGAWRYADTTASYGMTGAAPLLVMRCDRARRTVTLARQGLAASLTIRTSYAERSWPAQASPDGGSAVTFVAGDPALDQIAFSRGRFSIAGPGLAEIDIPAWAEPSRVIEDCRG